jgi:flagellar biosynthesis protein FlhF
MRQRFYKIKADTLEDAYRHMRRRFGHEAIVISTRQTTEGGLLGYFGRKQVEITAAVTERPEVGERPQSAVERRYAENAGPVTPRVDLSEGPSRQDLETLLRDAQQRMNAQQPAAMPEPTRAEAPAAETPTEPKRPAVSEHPSGSAGRSQVPPTPKPQPKGGGGAETYGPYAGGSAAPVVPFPQRAPEPEQDREKLQRDLQEMREMIQVLYAENPGAGLPTECAPLYQRLVSRGVARKVAADLTGAVVRTADATMLREERALLERLRVEICKRVKTTGALVPEGGKCRVVALCGATGVGKTTNLAKLAGQLVTRHHASVALITTDTYRIAAPEQLRVYANIIGMPLKVANDAEEVRRAVEEFRDYDLVLMDTPGGSQFNLEQINELRTLLSAARPDDTLLALSAGTPLEDMRNVVGNMRCLKPTALMFTKTDETRQYGAMVSCAIESALPVSYISYGQDVPEDIRTATPQALAGYVLEGSYKHG